MGKIGKASIKFENGPIILARASVVGPKESEGPLAQFFDEIVHDPLLGKETWEEAEGELQNKVIECLLNKACLTKESIRYIFSGDLLAQLIATYFGTKDYEIPTFGLYGACSTMGEGLALGAMTVAADYADYVICMASSHFASAEKQFRYPLDYGAQRPLSATWTVTGAGGVILGHSEKGIKITGVTTGRVVDYGVRDSMNMGAVMAPAAAEVIYQNLMDFEQEPSDYDAIYTGDLGYVGQTILIKLLKEKGYDISAVHHDCGIEVYDNDKQDTHSGGSGCGCSAVTLCASILKNLEDDIFKRVLFVPTGALLSTISYNEGQTVPGIAHAVVLEKIS